MINNPHISVTLTDTAIIFTHFVAPTKDVSKNWIEPILAHYGLSINEYEINADYHQASFYFENMLFLITACGLTDSVWINATHPTNEDLNRLYAHLS